MRPHPDADQLALAALGEDALSPDEQAHVTGCGRCSRTVVELADTVRVARGPRTDDVSPVPVPAHVWQGIAGELGVDPSVRPASVGPSVVRSTPGAARHEVPAPVRPTAVPALPAGGAGPVGAPAQDLPRALRAHRVVQVRLLAVAAAGLVVGAAGAAAVASWTSEDAPPVAAPTGAPTAAPTGAPSVPERAVVAATDLVAFGAGEDTGVSGAARLEVLDGTGTAADRVLLVELDALPDTGDDFLEAWLIDADTGAMVSLGPVPGGAPGAAAAVLTVPRGLDVSTFDLVDVSAEPLDGDPTHSGASLVRGTLGT